MTVDTLDVDGLVPLLAESVLDPTGAIASERFASKREVDAITRKRLKRVFKTETPHMTSNSTSN